MNLIPQAEVERMSEEILVKNLGAQECKRVSRAELGDLAKREGLEGNVKTHDIAWNGPDFTKIIFTQTYLKLNGVYFYNTYQT